ncbi:MAG: tryptophan 7-halogenase, partial [Chitinophagales bacterium]
MNKEKRCLELEEENKNTSYDVIIVGAGPAGSASAISLAQKSLKVGLIDIIHPNRPKVGESIPAAIKRLLQRLDIKGIESILRPNEYKSCISTASAWGENQWHYQDAILNPEGNGWHIDRNAFDAALYQQALEKGVIPIRNQVKSVTVQEDYYTVKLKSQTENSNSILHTKWLIDATGRASKVGRSLGFEKEKLSEQMAAIAWVNTIEDCDFSTRIKSVNNGWWYTALLPNQKRIIAFHGLLDEVQQRVHAPDVFIESFNNANLVKNKISSSQITGKIQGKDASFGKLTTIAQHRFFAVGDAAVAFDPLAAQGIFFALYSGIQASEAIIKSQENPTLKDTFCSTFVEQIERVFQYNQKTLKLHYNNEIRFLNEAY